ncbi:MAG: deoxyribodipyrimidine photo-lyase [Bacilli bacterium]|nr:deoxyribodipyrimidine photo-lyase [Bacilli bacterium]
MQQSQRVQFNHAFSHAIDLANAANLPLVVFFNLVTDYPNANLRHYKFMLEGLTEVQKDLQKRKIEFIIKIGNPIDNIRFFYDQAEAIVIDIGYTSVQRRWRKDLYFDIIAKTDDVDLFSVEWDVIIPVRQASDKAEYGAYTLRPKYNRNIDDFLDTPSIDSVINPIILSYESDIDVLEPDSILSSLNIDKSVAHSPIFHGGYTEAKARLKHFIDHSLARYPQSNDPSLDLTSKLSPYLHFGQISPLEIYLQVINSQAPTDSKSAFIEQLTVRRELAINYVFFTPDYDVFESMTEPWAYNTMNEHASDQREHLYSIEDYILFNTHDTYFNAAMKQMVTTGYMHNYMRMYWAKKIIEWSLTYKQAYETISFLNDKYFLDGRDPSSYAGIAWCFGKHDRPWTERPVFGKLRYMNAKGLERKFNISDYVDQVEKLGAITE